MTHNSIVFMLCEAFTIPSFSRNNVTQINPEKGTPGYFNEI